MKTHSLSIAAATALLSLAGCTEKVDYGDPVVSVNPSSVTVSLSGEEKTVQLNATVKWALSGYTSEVSQWITVTPAVGEPSKELQPVTVKVAANQGEEREAVITFTSEDGTKTAKLTISQPAYYPDVIDATAKEASDVSNPYKYQRYRLSGTVKDLSDAQKGVFKLVDATGSITVNGLSASETTYGTETSDFAKTGASERDKVTLIGYILNESGKNVIAYAYKEKVETYSEPDPDAATSVNFPFTADFTKGEEGFIINNKVFPYAFEAIWTNSSSDGMKASGYISDAKKYAVESWLYSPFIDLKSAKKPVLTFYHCVNFFESVNVAKQQTAVFVRAKGGDWKQLNASFSYPDELSGKFVTSEDFSLSSYAGSTVQVAFKYVSTEDKEAGTWTIKNFSVAEDTEGDQKEGTGSTENYNKPGWDWTK